METKDFLSIFFYIYANYVCQKMWSLWSWFWDLLYWLVGHDFVIFPCVFGKNMNPPIVKWRELCTSIRLTYYLNHWYLFVCLIYQYLKKWCENMPITVDLPVVLSSFALHSMRLLSAYMILSNYCPGELNLFYHHIVTC